MSMLMLDGWKYHLQLRLIPDTTKMIAYKLLGPPSVASTFPSPSTIVVGDKVQWGNGIDEMERREEMMDALNSDIARSTCSLTSTTSSCFHSLSLHLRTNHQGLNPCLEPFASFSSIWIHVGSLSCRPGRRRRIWAHKDSMGTGSYNYHYPKVSSSRGH